MLDKAKNPDKYCFKSKIFNQLEYKADSLNHYEGTLQEVNEILKERWFDPLRQKEEFKELEKATEELLQGISKKSPV